MSMKSIIVCGMDGSGKTHLAEQLRDYYQLPIHWAGPPAKDDTHALQCSLSQLELMVDGPRIFDRVTPISRQCYQFDCSSSHKQILNSFLSVMLHKAILIWCNPTNLVHKPGEHDSDDHLKFLSENHDTLCFNYVKIMSQRPHIEYNFQADSFESLVEQINERVS